MSSLLVLLFLQSTPVAYAAGLLAEPDDEGAAKARPVAVFLSTGADGVWVPAGLGGFARLP